MSVFTGPVQRRPRGFAFRVCSGVVHHDALYDVGDVLAGVGAVFEVLEYLRLSPVNWLETYGLTNFAVILAAVWSMMGLCIVIFLFD